MSRPTSRQRSTISTWLLSVGLATVVSGALAGEQPRRSLDPVVTVHFADLNTSSAEGTRILYERIASATRAVCGTGADWYPSVHWSKQECYRATVDHLVARLSLPALTALHVARTESSFQASNR